MHEPIGPDWLVAIEKSGLAQVMRESLWMYPIVEIVHIVGFVFLAGTVISFDLRLLGLSRGIEVQSLAHHLLPWSVGSLLLVVPAGLLMFSAHATEFAANPVFLTKLSLIALAGINAGVFHLGPYRSAWRWQHDVPSRVKWFAASSIALWLAVIACGRLLAYT
jgi:uncharacterized protein DUF6644